MASETPRMTAVGLWGVLGFVAILLRAIAALTPVAIEAFEVGLNWWQAVLCLGYSLFMIYSEGYKGFHLQTAPRVVARALCVSARPRLVHAVFAPLFCMGLFHASRRRLLTSWVVVGVIVALVLSVRLLAQPWRGIVDCGVVLGLAFGTGSVVYFLIRALAGRPIDVDPDLP